MFISKTKSWIKPVLAVALLFFVVNLVLANQATKAPTYCTKTSDCGALNLHQDCVNGTCGCILGYTWEDSIFACTGK